MRLPILVLCCIVLLSAFAPVFSPYDPMRTNPTAQLQPPSGNHLMGTDLLGRDVFTRLLHGGRRTLVIAFSATFLAVISGAGIGILTATSGVWGRHGFSGFTNVLFSFPNLLIAMLTLTILGSGLFPLIIATGLTQIASFARVVHSQVLAVLSEPFVESGYAIGARHSYILRFYVLPNTKATLLIYTAVTFSYCLLNGAALSYLGLGGEPGIPEWGVMLAEGRTTFQTAVWIAAAPGITITLIVWAVNRLTDHWLSATN